MSVREVIEALESGDMSMEDVIDSDLGSLDIIGIVTAREPRLALAVAVQYAYSVLHMVRPSVHDEWGRVLDAVHLMIRDDSLGVGERPPVDPPCLMDDARHETQRLAEECVSSVLTDSHDLAAVMAADLSRRAIVRSLADEAGIDATISGAAIESIQLGVLRRHVRSLGAP